MIEIEKAGKAPGATNLLKAIRRLVDTEVHVFHYADPELHDKTKRINPDAILIGGQGTPWWLYSKEELATVCQLIRDTDIPILGICGGHQLIAIAFDAPVAPIRRLTENPSKTSYEGYWRERGNIQVKFNRGDPILDGIAATASVWANHCEEVKALPIGFISLAQGERSPIQMMRHETRPIFGCQFHPEKWTEDSPAGRVVLLNFLNLSSRLRSVEADSLKPSET